jgi:predicted NBD/HSP70 family sugar kinase
VLSTEDLGSTPAAPGAGAASPAGLPSTLTHGELLGLLRRSGPLTRRDLLAVSRLSRSTLVERLDTLQRLALVRAGERRSGANGRPPVMLEFDDSSRTVLAVDLGATHATVALTDLSGRVLDRRRLSVDLTARPRQVLAPVLRSAGAMVDRHRSDSQGLLGVGLSFPGLPGEQPGTIEAPAVLAHWDCFDAAGLLEERFGVPAMVVNDAHAMAYGEYLADGRRRTLLTVKVATGIGAGLVVDGRLHRGDSRGAGQFGHMRVPGLDERCACGEHGCLATIASGRALLRRLAPHGVETLDDIARAAADGHRPTVEALREGGRAMGVVLSGVATMLDPGAILFGGRLGPLPPFLDAVRDEVQHLTYARTATGIEVGPTVLGELSAVTGLAGLIVDARLDAAGVDRMVASMGPAERLPRRSPTGAH